MPEGADLRVSEPHQPDDERVHHVAVKEHLVLALANHVLQQLTEIGL